MVNMPTFEQRGKNSWRLVVDVTKNSAGKKRNHEKKTIRITDPAILNSPTKLQNHINMELAKFQIEVDSGKHIKVTHILFSEFIETWEKNHAEEQLGGFTLKNYISIINSQLIPEFGDSVISKIKTIDIVSYFTKLRSPDGRKDGKKKPLATNTLLNIYTVLKSIFDTAHQWDFINKNPMDGVRRPLASKSEKKEMKLRKKSLTSEEAIQVILVLSELPSNWSLYFIGLVIGGFRRGEMSGIEWPAVDFKQGGLMIEKQITFSKDGETIEGDVKTVDSEAFVPMPNFYMNTLKDYKKEWEEEKDLLGSRWLGGDKQFLFHGGYGDMLYPDAPTKYWVRLRKKENLPNIRLHDLRHTMAMLLREEDVDMKTIQERLRHARLETTSRFYTHESEQISRQAADLLEKYDPAGQFVQNSKPGIILGS